ncbi:response regulator [Sutcliffiella cohnii]|uniref:response regulator n=1 Tax=Sutcliffiella cohnii TaxID=33932 RepID=UPI002E222DA3|nr:response regulator [Sutcliffiella cohnii]MED4017765.1 response regulator [Sutcliffiella cohnii]
MINVLIVEDDFRIADIHEKFLREIDDVNIIGKALRASDAMEIIEKEQVDLLLLDIYIPDKLGTDLIHEIKKKHVDLDFIVITAANNTELLDTSLKSGAFYYLLKPVSISKFTDVIESYKKRRKSLKSSEFVDQKFIDDLIGNKSIERGTTSELLPKGVNPLTLNKVIRFMEELPNGITAEDMGLKLGASRTTARRYLEYLVSIGKVKAELEYGIVGRPERMYFSDSKR